MLTLEEVSAGYGRANVLSGVSMRLDENESVAIVGANGAGKSTLVRVICGLLPVRGGRILKDGQPIEALPAHRRVELGIAVVLENRHLFGELSVRTNLELAAVRGAARKGAGIQFTVDAVLDLFPFMKARLEAPVELLSGGEQQMVAVGRALLLNPDLLVLDEPSTGLAPKVVRDIVAVIGSLRGRGLSLLLVEQNVAIAAESSDRAYVMAQGRVTDAINADRWAEFASTDALAKAYLGHH